MAARGLRPPAAPYRAGPAAPTRRQPRARTHQDRTLQADHSDAPVRGSRTAPPPSSPAGRPRHTWRGVARQRPGVHHAARHSHPPAQRLPGLPTPDPEGRPATGTASRPPAHLRQPAPRSRRRRPRRHGDPRTLPDQRHPGHLHPRRPRVEPGSDRPAGGPAVAPILNRLAYRLAYLAEFSPRDAATEPRRTVSELGFHWSRLSESNRRPIHYEAVSGRSPSAQSRSINRGEQLVLHDV